MTTQDQDMPRRRVRRRKLRKLGYTALVILVLLVGAAGVLRWRYNGEALARVVESALHNKIRGTLAVRSVEWPLGDLGALATGGWVHLKVSDIVIHDEFGNKVVDTPGGTLEINIRGALFGSYRLRNIRLAEGGHVYLKQVKEPYPAHEYDTSVISLVSAFYPKMPPVISTGYSAGRGVNVEIENFLVEGNGKEQRGVTVDLDLGKAQVHVEGIRGSGFLYYGGADPLGDKLYYSLASFSGPPTVADSATIRYGGPNADDGHGTGAAQRSATPSTIALHSIEILALGQLPSRWPAELVPRDLRYKLRALGDDGMSLTLEGAMLDSWVDIFGGDLQLDLKIDKAGALVRTASGGIAGGKDLSVHVKMSGPVLAPKGSAEIENLEINVARGKSGQSLYLLIDSAVPSWDTATDTGSVQDMVAHALGRAGRIEMSGDFRLSPLHFNVDINIAEPVDLATYLGEDVVKLTGGGSLSGSLSASGNAAIQRLDRLQLSLGKARVSGLAYREGGRIVADSDGLEISLPGLRLHDLRGSIDPAANQVALDFRLAASDAGRYFRLLGMPPSARQIHGDVAVRGNLDDPTVSSVNLTARGLPYVGQASANIRYTGNRIEVRKARSLSLGGTLEGHGELYLGNNPSLVGIKARAINLQLATLPVIGHLLTGRLNLGLSASGSLRHPQLSAVASLSDWTLAGEQYADTVFKIDSKSGGEQRLEGRIKRKAGGVLRLSALLRNATYLSGSFSLDALPLDGLLSHMGLGPALGGSLSTSMELGGTLAAPTLRGNVAVLRSWLSDAFLGAANLHMEPVGSSQVRITGHILQHRVVLDWLLTTKAPYKSEISLHVRRLELDRFLPELHDEHDVRSWISGVIDFKGDLLGRSRPDVRATLSEAEVLIAHSDEQGRPSPIRFRNRTPLSLTYDGELLRFTDKAIVAGPAGDFTMSGQATEAALDFTLSGAVAVQLLQPYLSSHFDSLEGEVRATVHLAGGIEAPRLTGVVTLKDLYLKLAGQDAIVSIPSGKIDVSNSQLSLTGLRILVSDQFSDDVSELHIAGGLQLDNFMPEFWAMRVDGQLAGKMLLAAAPEVFSSASGSARISVALLGEGTNPDIDGIIEFSERDALSITPRAARREITLTTGVIRFTDQLIEFEGIQGTVDGEGKITKLEGDISLDEWRPADVDLSISTRDVAIRIPRTLELAVHLRDFEVVGDGDQLEISGHIEVADGRYIQRFDPFLDALRPTRTTSTEKSIFEEVPLLGNAHLNLELVSRSFMIANNVANIELSGELDIRGTPLAPRIDGIIHVVEGRIKFPLVRAHFTRTRGSITFSPTLAFPFQTPTIDIESESDYTSSDGQTHLVQLRVRGPISKLSVDLGTSAGLNKQQTYQLILSGRSPEALRRSLLGDKTAATKPGEFATQQVTNSDNRLDLIDQVTKDIAGDYLSNIGGDRLREVTGLDVARLQLGTSSVGFRGEKILTRSSKFVGEYQRSLIGWNLDLRTDYRFSDDLSFGGKFLKTAYDDEAYNDKTEYRVGATIRRFWIP